MIGRSGGAWLSVPWASMDNPIVGGASPASAGVPREEFARERCDSDAVGRELDVAGAGRIEPALVAGQGHTAQFADRNGSAAHEA